MGWENRNGSRYYYRKERRGGRVRSVYVGRGEMAEVSAALDGMQQDDQERDLWKEQREREASRSLDANIDSLRNLATTLTDAILIAGGFHQHKRQWRKRKV